MSQQCNAKQLHEILGFINRIMQSLSREGIVPLNSALIRSHITTRFNSGHHIYGRILTKWCIRRRGHPIWKKAKEKKSEVLGIFSLEKERKTAGKQDERTELFQKTG